MKNFFKAEESCFKHLKRSAEMLHEMPWELVVKIWTECELLTPDFSSNYPESWSNVCAHSATAAILASKLAHELLSLGYSLSTHDVTLAMLLHDSNKKLEMNQIKLSQDVNFVSIFNQKWTERIRSTFGDRIAELTLCTGDIGYEKFSNGKFSCEELIVFYSDICTSDQHVVGYEKRFAKLQEHFQSGGRYGHTEQYFQRRYGKSWMQCNLEVIFSFEELFKSKGNFVDSKLSCYLVPEWCL